MTENNVGLPATLSELADWAGSPPRVGANPTRRWTTALRAAVDRALTGSLTAADVRIVTEDSESTAATCELAAAAAEELGDGALVAEAYRSCAVAHGRWWNRHEFALGIAWAKRARDQYEAIGAGWEAAVAAFSVASLHDLDDWNDFADSRSSACGCRNHRDRC